MVTALPYDADASTYLDDGVLALAEGVLLDDDRIDEVGGCHHTWLHRDLRERHNEVAGEDMNSLVENHDAEAAHTSNRKAEVEGRIDSTRLPD